MYFSDDDFLNMFAELGIEEVIVKCYGEKAGLPWGLKVMRLCRDGDPNCEISFDAAISIPPHMMHWGKSEHMVPTLPKSPEQIPQNPLLCTEFLPYVDTKPPTRPPFSPPNLL
jgi:hypothetical protein